MKVPAAAVLFLVLLAEAMIARFLTGSALHLALVLCAAVIFSGLRLIGAATARVAGFGCAAALGVGGWHLFESGLVPISFSELPGLFHIAVGVHFFLWTLTLGGRPSHGKRAVSAPELGMPGVIAGIFAGAVVAWTTGTIEIYGTSELLVRSLGFGVLAGCILLGLASRPSGRRHLAAVSASPSGGRWKAGGAALAIAMAGILLAAGLISPARRAAGQLYEWFGTGNDSTLLEEFSSGRPAIRSGAGDTDSAGRELPRKADIELDNSLRFFLEVDDDRSLRQLTRNRVYTRTSTLSVFADDGRLIPLRSGQWRYDGDDGVDDGKVTLTGALPDTVGSVTYSVLIERRDSRAVPMIARTQSVTIGSIYAFADDWYQLALEEEQERVRFRATATQRTVRELLASGMELKAGTTPGEYLLLPETALAKQVRTEAVLLSEGGRRDLEFLLPKMQTWLGERCSYSLRYDNPDDKTPVENFLYGEKKGHCELFAAGTVMLLRALKIPSRVAYGFCGGAVDSRKRILAFRESDFHAWAEIYLEGHGWVIFETTPPGAGSVRPPRDQTGGPAFADVNLAGYDFLGDFGPIETVKLSGFSILLRDISEFATDWFFAICAGVIAAGALVLWFRRRRTGSRNSPEAVVPWPGQKSGKANRTPDFLTEYLRTCRDLGFHKNAGQTWREFLRTLKTAGVCNGEFDELTHYVYRIRYAGCERDPALEKNLRESVKRFGEAGRNAPASDLP